MIKWNHAGLSDVNSKLTKALNKTTYDTLTDINQSQVVPFHIGTLEGSGQVAEAKIGDTTAGISWNTPYAKKLYFHPEYNFRNGRMGRWADNWIRGSKRKWILRTFKTNAKGLIL